MNFDRLRQLLIQKAIEGKLVPQLDTEPSMQQIGTPPSKTPFEIPEKWKWLSLENCLTLRSGDGLSKKDYCLGKIPVYGGNGINGYHNVANVMQKTIVIGRVGFYCGNVRLTDGAAWVTDNALIVNFKINVDLDFMVFLLTALNLGKKTSQTAQPVVTGKIIKKLIAPIPPLAEQHRIVARLNELLAVIKQAEDAYTDLQSLGKTLRERILQKAIEGKLVPQLDEEPAVEQIGEIPNKAPFAIPQKWKWRQLRMLVAKRRTIDPSSLTEDNVQLLSIPAYDNNRAEIINPAEIGSSKKLVFANDLLVSKIVPHISRAWIVPASPLPCLASTEWIVFSSEGFHPDYLRMIFISEWFREKMLSTVSGMGSLKRANPSQVCKEFIPVPPLAEQRRIVAKLNELLSLVDQMTAV